MKKIKNILVILIVCIIIISIVILILLRNKKINKTSDINNQTINEDNLEEWGEEYVPEQDEKGYVNVEDANIFFSIADSVEKYTKIINYNTENPDQLIYVGYDEFLLNIKNENDRKNAIYNLIDKDYKETNNINTNNVLKKIYNIDINTILIPIKMKVKYGTNINTYIYEAYIYNTKTIKDKFFIVRVDNKTNAFSIEFINQDIKDIKEIEFEEKENAIEKNTYNEFNLQILTNDQIAQKYIENYKELATTVPKVIYNNYFEEEYKTKRFETYDNYKKYIKHNQEEIKNIQITQYKTNTTENGKTQYICTDQYDNIYTFTQESVMQYKVMLDVYTIENNTVLSTYNSSEIQDKVKINVEKFIQMLNCRDYKTAYEKLNDKFKTNNFGSEEKFEQYMKSKYPIHYKAEYMEFEDIGNGIYSQKIVLTDVTGIEDASTEMSIVMKLNEGTDFEISFEI